MPAPLFPPTRGSTACIFYRCRRLNLLLVGEFVSCCRTGARTQLEPCFYPINSNFLSHVPKHFRRITTRGNVSSRLKQFHQRSHFLSISATWNLFPATGYQRSSQVLPSKAHLRRLLFSLSTTTEEEPKSTSFGKFTSSEVRAYAKQRLLKDGHLGNFAGMSNADPEQQRKVKVAPLFFPATIMISHFSCICTAPNGDSRRATTRSSSQRKHEETRKNVRPSR